MMMTILVIKIIDLLIFIKIICLRMKCKMEGNMRKLIDVLFYYGIFKKKMNMNFLKMAMKNYYMNERSKICFLKAWFL